MKKLILFLIPFLIAAAPTRQYTYSSGDTISASKNTANEDAILTYLQNGVEVYKDGTILNADISGSAAIQAEKLVLTAINQNIANTGTFLNTGNVTVVGSVTATGLVARTTLTVPYVSTANSSAQGDIWIIVTGQIARIQYKGPGGHIFTITPDGF